MSKQYIQEARERLDTKFLSLTPQQQQEVCIYFSVYGTAGLYDMLKNTATSNKRYADRHGYGAGEMGYTSREVKEEAEEQESTKPIAKELAGLHYAILEHLFDSEI